MEPSYQLNLLGIECSLIPRRKGPDCSQATGESEDNDSNYFYSNKSLMKPHKSPFLAWPVRFLVLLV